MVEDLLELATPVEQVSRVWVRGWILCVLLVSELYRRRVSADRQSGVDLALLRAASQSPTIAHRRWGSSGPRSMRGARRFGAPSVPLLVEILHLAPLPVHQSTGGLQRETLGFLRLAREPLNLLLLRCFVVLHVSATNKSRWWIGPGSSSFSGESPSPPHSLGLRRTYGRAEHSFRPPKGPGEQNSEAPGGGPSSGSRNKGFPYFAS